MSASVLTIDPAGANNKVTYTALDDGVEFNALSIEYIDPAAASQSLAVTFNGFNIKVYLATNGGSSITSTAAQVQAAICGTKASNLLTSDNTAPSDGDTVTVGGQTYTFRTALTASTTLGEVLIGGSADAALLNLSRAINGLGTPGTDYGSLTLKHANVSASTSVSAHTITLTAKAAGTQYNGIITTESCAHLSFADSATLGGASATTIGADSIDTSLDPVSGVSTNNPRRTMFLLTSANFAGNDGTGACATASQAFFSGSTLEPTTGYSTVAVAQAAGWVFLGTTTSGLITLPTPQNLHYGAAETPYQAYHNSYRRPGISLQSTGSAASLLIACKLFAAQTARKGIPLMIKPWLDPALTLR